MKPLAWPTVLLFILTIGAALTDTHPAVTIFITTAFLVCAGLDLTRTYRRGRREHHQMP